MSHNSYKMECDYREGYTNSSCSQTYYYSPRATATSTRECHYAFETRNFPGQSTPKCHTTNEIKCTEGRGEPQFPLIEMQMGMIHGMNTHNASIHNFNSSAEKINTYEERIRMLEDENTVIKKRNQCLLYEKQVEVESRVKFEKRFAELESILQQERLKTQAERDVSSTRDEETSTTNPTYLEEGVQVWTVCRACKRELQSQGNKEPVIIMTKTELENLEIDMMALKENILLTEETLERSKKREQNYREQVARLFVEADSASTLCKTRLEEIKTLTQALTDREQEVKMLQRRISDMGKLLVKMNKRNEEEACMGSREFSLSEKEKNWIEKIEQWVRSTKNKSKRTSPR